MAGKKASFVLYHDLRAPLALLSDEQRGKLFLALFDYSIDGVVPEFDEGTTTMAFAFVRNALDRDSAAWAAKSEKRAEAGRKGGKQTQAKRASASFARNGKQSKAIQAVPVLDPVPVPVPVPVLDPEPAHDSNNAGKPRTRTKFVPPSVEDVRNYAADNGLSVDAGAFVDYYTARGWTIGRSGTRMRDWQAAVRNWSRRDAEQGKPAHDRNAIPSPDEYTGWGGVTP